eukprot:CAMPEP_0195145508 /NCGR_PEP_ID=MMETSP0448-20130528/169957_1 /TAXON_ID=66468 /ORGANISM="Heterocapsa triquestra, Strain CCMP 448" /LENGTH=119 /DNA_ID=CAMNT_0040184023 /DNA_START=174 /DNA_END=530 /DNA_ORIENTATION=+
MAGLCKGKLLLQGGLPTIGESLPGIWVRNDQPLWPALQARSEVSHPAALHGHICWPTPSSNGARSRQAEIPLTRPAVPQGNVPASCKCGEIQSGKRLPLASAVQLRHPVCQFVKGFGGS